MHPLTDSVRPSPVVSVVMSVHNDERHVQAAVEGVLAQTFVDFELIVIDDGSTDGTAGILRALAERDPRLQVHRQANSGLTPALIHACGLARGEFIARQDSDDASHPFRLDQQLHLIRSDARIGFVSCWTEYVGPDDEFLLVVERDVDPELATRKLLHERQGPPAHGSVMFRRELYRRVGGYRPQFRFAQDSDLWLRMAEQAWIAYVPRVLYTYRRSLGGASGARRPLQKRLGQLGHDCQRARMEERSEAPYLAEAERLSECPPEVDRDHRALGAAAYWLGSQLARNGDWRRASGYLRQAISCDPMLWRAWLQLAHASIRGVGQ
jgi:hypothetical protein